MDHLDEWGGNGFTPQEVEFMAEQALVHIVPRFRMNQKLKLIEGDFGPFRPPTKTQVPLWLALDLKRRGLCTIQTPAWLSVDWLTAKLKEERAARGFTRLPDRFIELSQNLLQWHQDVPNAASIRLLLAELREERLKKARMGLGALNHHATMLNNFTMMELNELRSFFSGAFEQLQQLERPQP